MQCLKCGHEFDPDLLGCPICMAARAETGWFNRWLSKAEDILIVLFLGLMVVMVLAQILMRNLFQSGITGSDTLVRHLVLWIAFFGAAVATRSRSHVKIDAVSNLIPKRFGKYLEPVISLFSFIVCCVLMYAAFAFVAVEFEGAGTSSFFNLPVWVMEAVLPLGYTLIAVRFLRNAVVGFYRAFREPA